MNSVVARAQPSRVLTESAFMQVTESVNMYYVNTVQASRLFHWLQHVYTCTLRQFMQAFLLVSPCQKVLCMLWASVTNELLVVSVNCSRLRKHRVNVQYAIIIAVKFPNRDVLRPARSVALSASANHGHHHRYSSRCYARGFEAFVV